MKIRIHPSQKTLKERYEYSANGAFIARQNYGRWKSGRIIEGSSTSTGHKVINIGGQVYLLHRLIWIWHFGDIPDQQLVDHKDGDRTNNRIENLRLATHSENHMNDPNRRGCSWVSLKRKWRAEITTNGVTRHLGYFDTEEAARTAYIAAKLLLHGEFAPEILQNE